MKGDKVNAEKQWMLLKGNIEQNPLYKPIYEHRENSYKLRMIKQDMIEHNWTEGDLSQDKLSNWTEGDLSHDENKKPGVETGVAGEAKKSHRVGVAGEKKEIGTESESLERQKKLALSPESLVK